MRIALGLVALFLAFGAGLSARAAEPAKFTEGQARRELTLRLWELEQRAVQIYPRRRDTPLRDLNMTDDEVREVQAIASKYQMPELLNISPVVTGCPCEEGGSCTEQVYLTSRVGDRTAGLQLSRKKNLWTVGTVQKWWLEYAALRGREKNMTSDEYRQARDRLLLQLPACTKQAEAAPTKVAESMPRK
jgi:hypothetical protein